MDNIWSRYYKDSIASIEADDIDTDKTLYEALKESVKEHSDLIAIEHGKRKFTYAELLSYVDSLTSALKATGLGKGDTLAICVNGLPATVFGMYAASKIGAPVTMVNQKLGPEGFKRLCVDTNVKVAIMTADLLSACVSILGDTPVSKIIVARYSDYFPLGDKVRPSVRKMAAADSVKINKANIPEEIKLYKFKELLAEHTGDDDAYEGGISPDSDALYFANASATGKVMIAALSSRALNSQSRMDKFLLGQEPVRVLSLIDRAYSCGFCLSLHTVLLTGSTVLLYAGDTGRFSLEGFGGYKPDIFIGYPSLIVQVFNKLASRPVNVNLTYLKKVISCGAVMNGGQIFEIETFIKSQNLDTQIERVYGMDETGAVYIYNPSELENNRIFGIPLPGILVKIMDPESERVMDPGEMGEICVCTPAAMTGYKDDDGSGERAMRRFKDGRTWILTGDLGHADEDGLIYFDGNSKNIFERDSVIVYPYIIEENLIAIDGVKEACVVKIERNDAPYIVAVIVPDDEYLFDAEKLDALRLAIESECELLFAPPMRPDDFEFRAYLPKENFGRNDHEALKKQLIEKYSKLDEEDDNDEDLENLEDLLN